MAIAKGATPWDWPPYGRPRHPQYPYYLESELDGGAWALAGDQAMGFIGHYPCRAQLCRGQTGLKARVAGDARISQQAVMVQYHGGCGTDGGAPAAEARLLP